MTGTAYITEFAELGSDQRQRLPIGQMPPVAQQTVSTSGTSAPSSAFNASTNFIRVVVTTTCYAEVATSPTATSSKMRLIADQPEYFGVSPGSKIAFIE